MSSSIVHAGWMTWRNQISSYLMTVLKLSTHFVAKWKIDAAHYRRLGAHVNVLCSSDDQLKVKCPNVMTVTVIIYLMQSSSNQRMSEQCQLDSRFIIDGNSLDCTSFDRSEDVLSKIFRLRVDPVRRSDGGYPETPAAVKRWRWTDGSCAFCEPALHRIETDSKEKL